MFGLKRETKVIISGETSRYERSMRNVKRSTKTMTNSIERSWKSTASKIASSLALIGVGYGVKELVGSFMDAAKVTEDYQIRLQALLGSVEEGSRLFKEMSDYASKVPFEFEQIMTGATQLAGVMKGGVDEIRQWMPLIGDLAAVSGLSIEKTTEQVVRMYSAGAGAADLFRERGITAMMGFEAGVSYSADETRKKMMDAWNKADSQFKRVTSKLADTWAGMVSMLSDKWFQFRNMIMDAGVFNELKKHLSDINEQFGIWIKNNADLMKQKVPEYIENIKNSIKSIVGIYNSLPDGVIGAAGTGIVARILTGSTPIGKAAAMVHLLNAQLKSVGLNIGNISDKWKDLKEHVSNIWDVMSGKKDWQTGLPTEGPTFRGPMPMMPEVLVTGEREEEIQPTMPFPTPEEMSKRQAAWEQAQVDIMLSQQDVIDANLKAKQQETDALKAFDAAVFDNWLLTQEEQAQWSMEYANRQLELEEDLAKKKMRLNDQARKNFVDNLLETFRQFSGQSKVMFALYKAVAISEAVISGIKSAIFAFEAGMSVGGPYAPAVAAAYMAASIAATGAQIAAIASTEIGSSGQPSAGGAMPTYAVSSTTGMPTGGSGSSLTINIEGDMIGDESYLEMLAEKISEAVENNDIRLVASEANYAGALA